MLIAVNPQNTGLLTNECPCVYNQGQLILCLSRNPKEEVLIDPSLPGKLKFDDLVEYINRKYPEVPLSVLEPEPEPVTMPVPVLELVPLKQIYNGYPSVTYIKAHKKWLAPVISSSLTILLFYILTMGALTQQSLSILVCSLVVSNGAVLGVQYIGGDRF